MNSSNAQIRRTSLAILLAMACLLSFGTLRAQTLTGTITENEILAPAADVGIVPPSGLVGSVGRSGFYTCPDMTWGTACARLGYSFPDPTIQTPRNGGDAPSSGTVTALTSSASDVALIEDYDTTSSAYSFLTSASTVEVTQTGYNTQTSVLTTVSAVSSSDWINEGAAFAINGAIDNGSDPATTFSIDFDETLDGSNAPTDGWTLAEIAAEFNTQSTTNSWGLTASVINDGSDHYLKIIASTEDDNREITISVDGDTTASAVGVGDGNPLTDLDFGGTVDTGYVATSGSETSTYPWLYTVDGGGVQSADSNRITIDGVSILLVDAGTTEIGGSVLNATVPGGNPGNVGIAGTAISVDDTWISVDLAGLAYDLSTTGAAAGQAGVGGAGGKGGAGANGYTETVPVIMFTPFPPLTIPNTRLLAAQGGIGGAGATAGVGGAGGVGGTGGAIDFSLVTQDLSAGQIVSAQSIGGTGGAGGGGGSGGEGGDGGDGVAAVESNNLLPVIAIAPGNTGGLGGMGGTGGGGGTGGIGGVVELDIALGEATVEAGIAAFGRGGVGGQGGAGGAGGQGGQGGDAISFDPEILGNDGRNAFAGGLGGVGGTGGVGGIGGLGGSVVVDNDTALMTSLSFGIMAVSEGGQGGQGGTGGTGGQGGTGGNGDADREGTFLSDIANDAGNGGLGGIGGEGGLGGRGGNGGTVEVNNNDPENRIEAEEVGIVARSLGGIGGTGGTSGTGGAGGTGGIVGYEQPNFFVLYNGTAGGPGDGGAGGNGGEGGHGGAGGNGGAVNVDNDGIIVVADTEHGSAIRAESLGGIGGLGGLAGIVGAGGTGSAAGSVFDLCTADPFVCEGYAAVGNGQYGLLLEWNGGSSGAPGSLAGLTGDAGIIGGAGGDVDVDNTGTLITRGDQADAILAISAAGVNGLNERYGASTYNPNLVFWSGLPDNAQIGGSGSVRVTNSGGIGTTGDRAAGMTGLSLALGQASGTVTLLNDDGVIETEGSEAHGIIAKSHVGTIDGFSESTAGAVIVSNNSGSVTVIGSQSSAIVALSRSEIGAASDVTIDNAAGALLAFGGVSAFAVDAGSFSATGDAGLVSLDNTGGSIVGHSADGAVLLQSLAADGHTSGGVTVTSSGAVAGTGSLSHGMRLVSGTGNIDLTNTGLLQGGTGGHAVSMEGGTANLLNNSGSGEIFTLGGLSDVVITGGAASEAIVNEAGGWMMGSIDLDYGFLDGTGNTIENRSGATYIAGTEVDLGHETDNSNLFTNAGVLSIGLAGDPNGNLQLEPTTLVTAATPEPALPSLFAFFATPAEFEPTLDNLQLTTVTGNFSQSAGGVTIADIAFDRNDQGVPGDDEMDRMFVTGLASLSGRLQLSPITGAGSAGTFLVPFLYAEGGVTDAGMEVHPTFLNGTPSTTATFTPFLNWTDPNLVQLGYTIDYCPDGLTINQNAYCDAVTRIQAYGWSEYETVAANILRVVDFSDLQIVYDSLDGEGVVGAAEAQHGFNRQMGNAMDKIAGLGFDCWFDPDRETGGECDQAMRYWSDAAYGTEPALGDGNSASYEQHDYTGSFGMVVSRENAFVGLGVGAGLLDFTIPDRWMQGTGHGVWAGLGGGVASDNGLYIEANVAAGVTQSDYDRVGFGYSLDGQLDPHGISGDFTSALVQGGVRAGWRTDMGDMGHLQLFGAYDVASTSREDFYEDDPVWGNHYLSDRVTDHYATLGLTVSNRFAINRTLSIEPRVSIARTEAVVLDDRTISVRSMAADAEGFGWDTIGATPDYTRYELGLGLKLRSSNGLLLDMAVTTWESDALGRSSDAEVNFSWPF